MLSRCKALGEAGLVAEIGETLCMRIRSSVCSREVVISVLSDVKAHDKMTEIFER